MKNENIPVQNCVKAAFKFFTSINKTCWAHSGKIIQNLPSCIESISYIENESLIKIYDDQKTSFKEQVLFIKFIKYWIAMCYVLIICVHGRKDRHSTLYIFTYMYCACLFRGGEGSRSDRLTFFNVNIISGPKIPNGNLA